MKVCYFTSESDIDAKFMTLFEEQGFVPLVDGLHRDQFEWLKRYYMDTPHLFCWLDDDRQCHFGTVHRLQHLPSFVVYFTQNSAVSTFEWDQIELYFRYLINGTNISERTLRCVKKLKDRFAQPEVILQSEQPNLPQYYEFKSKLLEEQDIAVFEITKANGTTPYTTIVRNFSVKGYKPLFTNYFACNAFRKDWIAIQFLSKLWDETMQGPMDLDEMLKEATEACYPGENYVPIAEPEVYMKSMDEVLEMLGM